MIHAHSGGKEVLNDVIMLTCSSDRRSSHSRYHSSHRQAEQTLFYVTHTIQLRHVCVSASGLMNLQAALINRGTTRLPSKEGVNSTLISNPVPVGSTIYA